jgi:hypothetical protein
MVTRLVAEVLSQLKLNTREIHSRKTQSARTKVSDEFRKSKGLILVSSDVSARGVDYPDVTLVMQVSHIIVYLAKRKENKRKMCGFIKKFICTCRLVCQLIENSIYIDSEGLDGKARKGKASYYWLPGKCIFLVQLTICQYQRLQHLRLIQAFRQQ